MALIFLLFISSLNLVRTDDNVAMESNVNYQISYKVHPEPEINENYQTINQNYDKGGVVQSQTGKKNRIQINFQKYNYENQIANSNNLGYPQVNLKEHETFQPGLSQNLVSVPAIQPTQIEYPQPQLYLQHHTQPIQILGAETEHLRHSDVNNEKTLGFSSYVEHVSDKEEEEIKSAIKEGSINDIKRLVPKSGVSFKIYHSDKKSGHLSGHKTGTQNNLLLQNQGFKEEVQNSKVSSLAMAPLAPLKFQTIQTEFHQPIVATATTQQFLVKNEISKTPQNPIASQQIFHFVTPSTQEFSNAEYDTQNEETLQKTSLVESGGQTSVSHPHYKIKTNHGGYSKATSEIEFSKNLNTENKLLVTNKGLKSQEANDYYKQQHTATKGNMEPVSSLAEGLISTNQGKGVYQSGEAIQYHLKPPIQTEAVKNQLNNPFASHLHLDVGAAKNEQTYVSQTSSPVSVEPFKQRSGVTHTTPTSYVKSHSTKINTNYKPQLTIDSYSEKLKEKTNYARHSTATPYISIDEFKHKQVNLKSTMTLNSHKDNLLVKTTQIPHLLVKPQDSHVDVENLQSNQHHYQTALYGNSDSVKISHNTNNHETQFSFPVDTYIDAESTKIGQNNFDHQKALEGSTSFDIKNAIGSADTHVQQPLAFITPTPETHANVFEKQTYSYTVPKIPFSPTAITLTGNHIQESSYGKDHNIENLIQGQVTSSHEFTYPGVSLTFVPEMNGKYFSQPQTISLWTDHFKQGNGLTANDLHQSLIKLHLPKEIPQHLKAPNIGIPVSFLTHPKQPVTFFHEKPLIKFNQEMQHKSPSVQNIRVLYPKLPPLTSLEHFKNKFPKVNMNSFMLKPDMMSYMEEPGKKIIPILMKKRKNRSNKDVSVIYGKSTSKRGPLRPNQRQEKNIRSISPPNDIKVFDDDRKNEFSVSASYKIDRNS